MVRGLHWFAYTLAAHKHRELQPFQLRDGEAARCLTDALVDHGFRSKDCIINYPARGLQRMSFDFDRFPDGDVLLQVTRPPIDDLAIGDKKGIPRSFTPLEGRLFEGPFKRVFECCARSQIRLTDLVAGISPEIGARKCMEFRQNGGPEYHAFGAAAPDFTRFKRGNCRTVAFLIYFEHAWSGGPAFLVAFSIGGTGTLAWCRLLQTRFSHLLRTTSFAMAEIESKVPKRPQTLDFAQDFDVKLLGTAPLGFFDRPGAVA
jgi:hypothetical protein